MSDPMSANATRPEAESIRSGAIALFAVAITVGLLAGPAGSVATAQQGGHEPLSITTACTDGTSTVEITNPNDGVVEVTVAWDEEQNAIDVSTRSERRLQSGVGTVSPLAFAPDSFDESVTIAVPATDTVVIEGLTGGTYTVTAATDGEEVPIVDAEEEPLEENELTLDCESEAESAAEADDSGSEPGSAETEPGDGEIGETEPGAADANGAETEETETGETETDGPDANETGTDEPETDTETRDAGETSETETNEAESDATDTDEDEADEGDEGETDEFEGAAEQTDETETRAPTFEDDARDRSTADDGDDGNGSDGVTVTPAIDLESPPGSDRRG